MAQITSGIRSILSMPRLYDLFQGVVGASRARHILCNEYLKPRPGDVLVDVGCGTAEILEHLPAEIRYFGLDLSSDYIATAQSRYGQRGEFTCADITTLPADAIPLCNLAISFGVLHHLDDEGASALLRNIHSRLVPRGRLITIDPTLAPGQSIFARALIERDRGQNVRSADGYVALAAGQFSESRLSVREDLLHIPYTHAIVEFIK